jgi:hypothetical protein
VIHIFNNILVIKESLNHISLEAHQFKLKCKHLDSSSISPECVDSSSFKRGSLSSIFGELDPPFSKSSGKILPLVADVCIFLKLYLWLVINADATSKLSLLIPAVIMGFALKELLIECLSV